jgi:hypothetical protein
MVKTSLTSIVEIVIVFGALVFALPLLKNLPTPALIVAILVFLFWILKK